MIELVVRQAEAADLELLPIALGTPDYFADRLRRQNAGLGTLFIAWRTDQPVGIVYLWLEEAEERPIRTHLPDVPLLTHLEVLPEHRNQRIGTALIAQVEATARKLGKKAVALAVRTDNADAERLYKRLEYEHWSHGEITCYAEHRLPDDEVELEAETCYVMVRSLGAPQLVTTLHQPELGQDLLELRADRAAASL